MTMQRMWSLRGRSVWLGLLAVVGMLATGGLIDARDAAGAESAKKASTAQAVRSSKSQAERASRDTARVRGAVPFNGSVNFRLDARIRNLDPDISKLKMGCKTSHLGPVTSAPDPAREVEVGSDHAVHSAEGGTISFPAQLQTLSTMRNGSSPNPGADATPEPY